MGTSRKTSGSENQVSAPSARKISRHGGSRPGAGRKPGSRNKSRPAFDLEPCSDALARAVAGKPAFLFIKAMQTLEASYDEVVKALGMTSVEFDREYGVFLAETSKLEKIGSDAYFAEKRAARR